jgi:hypothetical protein
VGQTRLPALGALAGLVTGALIATVLVASGSLDNQASPAPPKPATAQFLAAFHRSLLGTYTVDATFTRQKPGVGTLRSPAQQVQQPPDHLTKEFGGVNGALGGFVVNCSTQASGDQLCAPGSTREDYATYVATSMRNLRSYFDAKVPLYVVVSAGHGCYDLTQIGEMAIAPYGTAARMCFDSATGAMSYLREDLEGAVDTFQADHITNQVSPSDFDLNP